MIAVVVTAREGKRAVYTARGYAMTSLILRLSHALSHLEPVLLKKGDSAGCTKDKASQRKPGLRARNEISEVSF
jgi:hypothetical protein